jgi:hypothetical protein
VVFDFSFKKGIQLKKKNKNRIENSQTFIIPPSVETISSIISFSKNSANLFSLFLITYEINKKIITLGE